MAQSAYHPNKRSLKVVGSFGSPNDLREMNASQLQESCDIAEIRLDLLALDGGVPDAALWRDFLGFPLLFTARRQEEGGAHSLGAKMRIELLEGVLEDASVIDIEVASIAEMGRLLENLEIPWVASFHDFEKLPATSLLEDAAKRANDAGAAVFKLAAKLHSTADLARLADFQLADQGMPVATMGMGALAPVSRLLCAQCGSVLNYGYLGKTPTAPGQWDAALLKQAIARLAPFEI